MILALALSVVLHADSGDSWMGRDKAKHFLLSAFIHSVTYSASRAVLAPPPAQLLAGSAVLGAGVLKELADRRAGRRFSVPDLLWGAAGGAAAAALLHGAR